MRDNSLEQGLVLVQLLLLCTPHSYRVNLWALDAAPALSPKLQLCSPKIMSSWGGIWKGCDLVSPKHCPTIDVIDCRLWKFMRLINNKHRHFSEICSGKFVFVPNFLYLFRTFCICSELFVFVLGNLLREIGGKRETRFSVEEWLPS